MKLLVAGGAGYIGSALVPRLLDRGYEVVVVDLLWFGNHLPQDVEVQHRDVFSVTEENLRGVDQVVFLAGLSNDPMAEYSPARNFIYNSASPAYLAYTAKRAGVGRFIYASSCSVYGYTVDELYDEDCPAESNSPYGISKLQGEQAVLQMTSKNFSVIALRKGTVSGYSPRMRLDLIVNTMFTTAARDGVVTVSNPAIWRPIAGLNDVVDAYVRAIEASDKITGVFNIASGNYTVGEVGDVVRDEMQRLLQQDVKLVVRRDTESRNYKVSTERARNVLSFKPRQDIAAIVDNLWAHRNSFSDFNSSGYYNIRAFQDLAFGTVDGHDAIELMGTR